MYASRFPKRKAIRARRPYKRVPRKRSGGRKAITKIVKSIISRQAENKVWADYGANLAIQSASATVPQARNLLPLLSPGTGVSSRIGNEVRVKTAYIRGHVNLLPYNVSTNFNALPCYVKMWLCSSRQINTQSISATSIATTFFEAGATSTGFQGNMLDIDFSPNKDVWIVHSTKTVKLGAGYVTSAGSPVSGGSYFDNSPMSVPFQFNYGKKCGTLKYDESITNATNKNMFLVFQVVPANGDGGSLNNMAEFHYTTRVEYEDM